MSWKEDKQWSDRFIPKLKRIIGECLISVGDWKEDAIEASDLIVMRLDAVRVACRIRRYSYFLNERYRDEFTVRISRPSQNETELSKIMSGWGDYMIYGFSDEKQRRLVKWSLFDLKVFRLHIWNNQDLLQNGYIKRNTDGSSGFGAWPIDSFPFDFVVDSYQMPNPTPP